MKRGAMLVGVRMSVKESSVTRGEGENSKSQT